MAKWGCLRAIGVRVSVNATFSGRVKSPGQALGGLEHDGHGGADGVEVEIVVRHEAGPVL